MAETEYSQTNLAYIRNHLENIEQLVRFDIAANPNSGGAVRAILQGRPGAATVYLALCDGPVSQEQIVSATGLSQSTVSRIVKHLYDSGLVQTIREPGNLRVTLYLHTDLERTLGVSKLAKELAGK